MLSNKLVTACGGTKKVDAFRDNAFRSIPGVQTSRSTSALQTLQQKKTKQQSYRLGQN